MATATDEYEYLDKKQWWLNELESLGISPKKTNQLNDKKEISNLAENIKQTLYHEYKIVYNEK
ncbi:MAG TPA: hypothetical protein VNB67_02860 [Nitrososphaeraceae archaeon]|jgi:hypothetical protein|nr:hypothetical protein [Nitrososphaeraceae archaeon]